MPGEHFIGEALEGLAEHDEGSGGGVTSAEVEVAEEAAAAAVTPFGGENDEVEGVGRFDFAPRLAACSGGVEGGGGFGHDALVALSEGAVEEGGGGGGVGGEGVGDEGFRGCKFAERAEAAGLFFVEQGLAVEIEEVEPEGGERELAAHPVDIDPAGEAAHGELEGVGAAAWGEGEDFAIEDEIAGGEGADGLDDFGHGFGDVVQLAGEDAHFGSVAMDLHAGSIHFEFESRLSEFSERLCNIYGGLGEHGLDGAEELEAEAGEAGSPLREGGAGDGDDAAGEHNGAAHAFRGEFGGFGDGVDHDAFEGSLAEFAHEEGCKEALFGRGGGGEEGVERGMAAVGGSRAADGGDRIEGAVDEGYVEGWRW